MTGFVAGAPVGRFAVVATPDALVAATGVDPLGGGVPAVTGAVELVLGATDAVDAAGAVCAGIVRAKATVVVPVPTTRAASDQLDQRRTCLRPLARGERGERGERGSAASSWFGAWPSRRQPAFSCGSLSCIGAFPSLCPQVGVLVVTMRFRS